jgi:hypothetical protein
MARSQRRINSEQEKIAKNNYARRNNNQWKRGDILPLEHKPFQTKPLGSNFNKRPQSPRMRAINRSRQNRNFRPRNRSQSRRVNNVEQDEHDQLEYDEDQLENDQLKIANQSQDYDNNECEYNCDNQYQDNDQTNNDDDYDDNYDETYDDEIIDDYNNYTTEYENDDDY